MPGSQFQSRGNLFFKDGRRRDTVSLAADREEPPESTEFRGVLPEVFSPEGGGIAGALDRLFGKGLDLVDRVGTGPVPIIDPAMDAIAGVVEGAEAGVADFIFGPGNTFADLTPDPVAQADIADTQATIQSKEDELETLRQDILDRQPPTQLNFEGRQALKEFNEEAEGQIKVIAEDIEILNNQLTAIQDNFAWESQVLEGLGLPPTVAAFREDEELAGRLDAVTAAVESGVGLDEALDALAEEGEDTLDQLGEAFGRDRYLADIQRSIKTQINNLVENRQQLEKSMVEAEDWATLEAQAQANHLWDMQGDPSVSGRGYDAVVAHMDPWMEATFAGILKEPQFILAAETFGTIWYGLKSAEVDEEGNLIEPDFLTGEDEQMIGELAIRDLGLSPAKAEDMLEQFRIAVKKGNEASAQASEWRTAERLHPGQTALGTAIYDVAVETYEPAEAEDIADSYVIHRLIEIRNPDGIIGRVEKDGNQFGLGNLPEHTYEALGYTVADLEDNAELQIEALLLFIGRKFDAGLPGVQNALSELIHSPDAWGEMP